MNATDPTGLEGTAPYGNASTSGLPDAEKAAQDRRRQEEELQRARERAEISAQKLRDEQRELAQNSARNRDALNNSNFPEAGGILATYDHSAKLVTVRYVVVTENGETVAEEFAFPAESKVRNELNNLRPTPDVKTIPSDGTVSQFTYPRVFPAGDYNVGLSIPSGNNINRRNLYGDVFIPTDAVQVLDVYGIQKPTANAKGVYTPSGTQPDTGYGIHIANWTWGCIGVNQSQQEALNRYAELSDRVIREGGKSTLRVINR